MKSNQLETFEKLPDVVLREVTLSELDADLGGETLKQGAESATAPEPPKVTPQQQPTPAKPTATAPTPATEPFFHGTQQTVNLAQLLTGETPVRLLNSFAPPILSIGFKVVAKRDIPKKVFEMSAEERKTVEPVLNEALKHLNINFNNPFVALGVSLAAVYGGKILSVVSELERYDKIEEQEERAAPIARTRTENRGRHKKNCASYNGLECNCKGG